MAYKGKGKASGAYAAWGDNWGKGDGDWNSGNAGDDDGYSMGKGWKSRAAPYSGASWKKGGKAAWQKGSKDSDEPSLNCVKQDSWFMKSALRPYPGADGSSFNKMKGAKSDRDMLDVEKMSTKINAMNEEGMNRVGFWCLFLFFFCI
jgi:hypothetical protein